MTDSGSFKKLNLKDFHELAEKYRPFFRNRLLGKSFFIPDSKWKFSKKMEKQAIHFLAMENSSDLSLLVHIAPVVLTRLINEPQYKEAFIPKKRGGKRNLLIPEYLLLCVQKRLNLYLQAVYASIRPDCVHGFVRNSSDIPVNIASNALPHVGKKVVLNLDLRDFFDSVMARDIREVLKSDIFRFDDHLATCITLLTTKNGCLPQGAPTSPVLSNFVCIPLDKALHAYCQEKKMTYTRYADDLSFSADHKIDQEIIDDLKNIISKYHFQLNSEKFRIRSANKQQCVTGVTVNRKLNVNRKFYKTTRAMLHDLKVNGLHEATKNHLGLLAPASTIQCRLFIKRLEGYIGFIGQIRGKNDPIYQRMRCSFEEEFSVD